MCVRACARTRTCGRACGRACVCVFVCVCCCSCSCCLGEDGCFVVGRGGGGGEGESGKGKGWEEDHHFCVRCYPRQRKPTERPAGTSIPVRNSSLLFDHEAGQLTCLKAPGFLAFSPRRRCCRDTGAFLPMPQDNRPRLGPGSSGTGWAVPGRHGARRQGHGWSLWVL